MIRSVQKGGPSLWKEGKGEGSEPSAVQKTKKAEPVLITPLFVSQLTIDRHVGNWKGGEEGNYFIF